MVVLDRYFLTDDPPVVYWSRNSNGKAVVQSLYSANAFEQEDLNVIRNPLLAAKAVDCQPALSRSEITLRCLINVRLTFINFKVFSHQYVLIMNRTFIRFVSIIAETKFIVLFCKNYSGFKV